MAGGVCAQTTPNRPQRNRGRRAGPRPDRCQGDKQSADISKANLADGEEEEVEKEEEQRQPGEDEDTNKIYMS